MFTVSTPADYKPKLIKCAEKIYKIENHANNVKKEDESRPNYVEEIQSRNAISVEKDNSFKRQRKEKGLNKTKREVSDIFVLTEKEQKGCQKTERKLHKYCHTKKFACSGLIRAMATRRIKGLKEQDIYMGTQQYYI